MELFTGIWINIKPQLQDDTVSIDSKKYIKVSTIETHIIIAISE